MEIESRLDCCVCTCITNIVGTCTCSHSDITGTHLPLVSKEVLTRLTSDFKVKAYFFVMWK